jgi:hypothetical protein
MTKKLWLRDRNHEIDMPPFNDAQTEAQLKRWMRPDAHRFIRPDWRRYVKPGFEHEFPFERYERKYSQDQPRVPAGSSDGGQWTSEGGVSETASPSASAEIKPTTRNGNETTQVAMRISPQREKNCEEQYRRDTFICNTIGTISCWQQAAFRFSQCLIGGYVPPIYH